MLNIYYKIWVDAIVFERTRNGQLRNWKLYTLIPISMLQGINLLAVFFVIRSLSHKELTIFFDVNLFNIKALNAFCSVAITLFIPFIVLNYFLIFNNRRYENLIKKYRSQNGKLYLRYFLLTIGVFIVPIIIGKWMIK